MREIASESDAAFAGPLRPIFAVFEGGGARGLAHVGALDAIKANNLEIIGVAGTSAGALAAVLAAIGLDGSDIMDAGDPTKHILAPMSPVDLLGDRDWKRLKRLQHRWLPPAIGMALAGLGAGALLSPRNASTAYGIYRRLGLFSTDEIQAFINRVIRDRLVKISEVEGNGRSVPDVVTFEVLASFPTITPLKIVATDVDKGTLELFDAHTTPHVVVSEAVAASISIPLAFQPARIPSFREGRFADGGMVSNLPIWVFSEDKLAFERQFFWRPPVPTIGFKLAPPQKPARTPRLPGWIRRKRPTEECGLLGYLGKLLHATLHGSQGTTIRFLDDVTVVELTSELDTFHFDKTWIDYDAARRAGFDQANRRLKFLLEAKPDRIRTELQSVGAKALAQINQLRLTAGKQPIEKIRVSLIEPTGVHSLRVVASVGMEADTDDRLLLDRRGRGAARVFRERDLRIFTLSRSRSKGTEYMTKYERALLRKAVKVALCVPIFKDHGEWGMAARNRSEPHGVLALDCDVNIASEFADPHLKLMLTKLSSVLYVAVSSEVQDG